VILAEDMVLQSNCVSAKSSYMLKISCLFTEHQSTEGRMSTFIENEAAKYFKIIQKYA